MMTLYAIAILVLGPLLIVRRSLLIAVVEGTSMMPTLVTGNRMLVWRWCLRRWLKKDAIVLIDSFKVPSSPELELTTPFHVEEREMSEVVTESQDSFHPRLFMNETNRPKRSWQLQFLGRRPASSTQIKRLVGLPGDTVRLHHSKALLENIDSMSSDSEFVSWTVPAGHCFVLGDNPDTSVDSRFYGAIPFKAIRGIAFYRFGER